jgi:DNA-binding transcriptional MerR regulator
LRFYERRGLVQAICRQGGRHYDPSILTRLALIEVGRLAGFTLAEIKIILDSEVDRSVLDSMARTKIAELETQIAQAELAKRYLVHTLGCPSPDPLACSTLRGILDQVLPRHTTVRPWS